MLSRTLSAHWLEFMHSDDLRRCDALPSNPALVSSHKDDNIDLPSASVAMGIIVGGELLSYIAYAKLPSGKRRLHISDQRRRASGMAHYELYHIKDMIEW